MPPPTPPTDRPSTWWATAAIRTITFVVPSATGFVTAFGTLRAVRPFATVSDQLFWVAVAIVVSVAVSVVVGIGLRRALPRTRLFSRASNFETELESRFRIDLREGNTKRMLRTGTIDKADEQQAQYVLDLLRRLTYHEQLTRGHSERVRAYATLIGRELDLPDERIDVLKWAALLHDVGKLDVAGSILASERSPTKAQWAVLKRHPMFARKYLEPLEGWLGPEISHGAVHHHERWDGTGYPDELRGDDIPLFGRIVAVADAFDVMTHTRSYKPQGSIDEARRELAACSGSHFDPEVVDALLRIGEAELRAVRGWSATVAGLSVVLESNVVAVGTQAVVVATMIASAIFVANEPVDSPPDALAFDTPTVPSTRAPTTTSEAPRAAPNRPAISATSTTPSTTTTSTTVPEPELRTLDYRIGSIDQDGVLSTVTADRLEVYVNDVATETIDLDDDQRTATVLLDVTDLDAGLHTVRFDLYDGDELVSSELAPIVR